MAKEIPAQASAETDRFFAIIKNPFKFRLFLMRRLPAACFSGLRITEVNDKLCSVSVPYKWFTKNPFRSTYFACLSMAAEMSTGVLAMANTYKRIPSISMLVTGIDANFTKKATGITTFICNAGIEIRETIEKVAELNVPLVLEVKSTGYNEKNEQVAEFIITWSFKSKSR